MDDRISVVRSPIYGSGGTINYTNVATNSANLPMGISGVWVTCSTDAWARLGPVVGSTAPVALTSDFFCPLGVTIFVPNTDSTGQPMQLSVVRDSVSGAAKFTPAN